MYNPYEEEMIRRRQMEQPVPMSGVPLYSGPEPAQWVPMEGDLDNGQMHAAGAAAGAGMASLLKRFRKPGGPSPLAHEAGHVTRDAGNFGPRFIS